MKTFSDSNTTIQQERYKDARFVRRVELLRQFYWAIKSRDSATVIKVSGDATDLLAVNEAFVIPLQDFTGLHIVTGISYNGGGDETTITCSDSTFAASGLPGLQIAKRFTVSGGNIERMIEMTDVRFDIEGATLNSFNASIVDFAFDNGDGFFANTDGDGIFDGSDIMWVRCYFGFKNSTDRVLYFGGFVQNEETQDDRFAKTFTITACGHIKELERYPAYLISEPHGGFLKISGIEIVDVTASAKTTAGIKKVDWKFREGGLQGVTVLAVTTVGTFGIVPLRFRFPNLLKFAWGEWTAVAENTESANLVGADGSVLTIKTNSYDVRDREIFLQIAPDLTAVVRKTGRFEMSIDNGQAAGLVTDFEAAITDEGSLAYFDRSNENDRVGKSFEALQASDAIIYLFTSEPFYGLELDLESSDLIGTVQYQFSNGLNSWQTLSPTSDDTADFTQSGNVAWSKEAVAGWRPITFLPGGSVQSVYNKYALKISLSAYTSGSAVIENLRRLFRVFAGDGTEISIKVSLRDLLTDNVTEDLILRQIEEVWTPCTWYRNISLQSLAEKILTEASYGAGLVTLDDLKITTAEPVISILGNAPEPYYRKRGKALLWDSGNEKLYLGIGDELWSVTETGEFGYIDKLGQINEDDLGFGLVNLSIRSLALDGGTIHGMAWWDEYDDMVIHKGDYRPGFYCWLFKSDGSSITGILKASGSQQVDDPQYIHPCELVIRKGDEAGHPDVGHDDIGLHAGENLMIPLPQIMRNYFIDEDEDDYFHIGQTMYDAEGLISGLQNTGPIFYFGNDWEITPDRHGDFLRALVGYYLMVTATDSLDYWIDFKYQMGQRGLAVYESGEGFIALQSQRDSFTKTDTHHRIGKISVDQAFDEIYDLSDSSQQITCGFIHPSLGDLYYAYMDWDDNGDDLSICYAAYVTVPAGANTIFLDFSTKEAEAGSSIEGDEPYMTILDMALNVFENAIHMCLLNRNNFEYHWAVLDRSSGELYSTQTGNGFTFDKHRQFKDFVYFDEKIYAVCVDKRYQTEPAFLVEAILDSGEIMLTRVDTIDVNDWDHSTLIAADDALWGITGKGLLWKYSAEFYPRVAYADFGDRNLREALNLIAQALNRVIVSRPDRKLRMTERDSYDGSKTLMENKHILKLQPLKNWEHYYDLVEVSWQDQVNSSSGTESVGTDGWERRRLKINNPLIQNRQLAAVVADQYHGYFNQQRKVIEAELPVLLELEEQDRVRFSIKSSNTDINRSEYFRLTNVHLDPESMLTRIKGVS